MQKLQSYRAWSDDVYLDSQDWEAIDKFIGNNSKLSSDEKKRIVRLMSEFYCDLCFGICSISPGDAVKNLSIIKKRCLNFLIYLRSFDVFEKIPNQTESDELFAHCNCSKVRRRVIAENRLDQIIRDMIRDGSMNQEDVAIWRIIHDPLEDMEGGFEWKRLREIVLSIESLRFKLDSLIEKITVEKGSCGDERTTKFLFDLHVLYSEVVGCQQISKNFISFARVICKIILKKYKNDFGENVKTRLKDFVCARDARDDDLNADWIRKRIKKYQRENAPCGDGKNT